MISGQFENNICKATSQVWDGLLMLAEKNGIVLQISLFLFGSQKRLTS